MSIYHPTVSGANLDILLASPGGNPRRISSRAVREPVRHRRCRRVATAVAPPQKSSRPATRNRNPQPKPKPKPCTTNKRSQHDRLQTPSEARQAGGRGGAPPDLIYLSLSSFAEALNIEQMQYIYLSAPVEIIARSRYTAVQLAPPEVRDVECCIATQRWERR